MSIVLHTFPDGSSEVRCYRDEPRVRRSQCSALTAKGRRCRMVPNFLLGAWPVCAAHLPDTGGYLILTPEALHWQRQR